MAASIDDLMMTVGFVVGAPILYIGGLVLVDKIRTASYVRRELRAGRYHMNEPPSDRSPPEQDS